MTAPDDVRARFEAWVQRTRGWAACKARNKPMYLRQTSDGNYCDYRVNDRWMAYRAAHADLSGEVRELVEVARVVERRLIPLLSGTLRDIDHADFVAFFAALAKFTQEKP